MTSSGRYTYAREILSKKTTKVLSIIKRSFSNSDSATNNKLFDALAKPVLLYACEIWGPELLSYRTHFDKSTIKQVQIKFCKQTLNVPWYIYRKHYLQSRAWEVKRELSTYLELTIELHQI